jgi:hypothetical protein
MDFREKLLWQYRKIIFIFKLMRSVFCLNGITFMARYHLSLPAARVVGRQTACA